MTAAGPVRTLQGLLETIYDVPCGYRADEFLITDPALARALDRDGRPNREKLLIRHGDGTLDLSLYIDAGALATLVRDDPLARLDDDNFDAFCLVLEGVSHFLYVAWNAKFDKRVTLLELELQAEVDKFVAASALLRRQHRRPAGRALLHRLFGRVRFADALGAAERARYVDAHCYARRYCQQLAQRLHRRRRVVADLRRFYRSPKLGKLGYAGA